MSVSKNVKLVVAILVAAALALTFTTYSVINVSKSVSSSGTISTTPNVGVYSDSACTSNLTTINWGSVAAGNAVAQTVYVKNTGTGTITLGLSTSSWNPTTASTYITVSWNQQGTQLVAGQSTAAVITLTVASTITGFSSFSNSITVTGSQ